MAKEDRSHFWNNFLSLIKSFYLKRYLLVSILYSLTLTLDMGLAFILIIKGGKMYVAWSKSLRKKGVKSA